MRWFLPWNTDLLHSWQNSAFLQDQRRLFFQIHAEELQSLNKMYLH